MAKKGAQKVVRDARIGRFVERGVAKRRPSTTVIETIERPTKRK